jgi:hypothetical protein
MESDSESELPQARKSPFTSPVLKTPAAAMSSPPTSGDDQVPQDHSKELKGKGKAPPGAGARRKSGNKAKVETFPHSVCVGFDQTLQAPTKKDMMETTLNRYRIAADQPVEIARVEAAEPRFTISKFLQGLNQ